MAGVPPPADFAKARLATHIVQPGERFGRIYLEEFPNPLGFGKRPSRFSDPRRRVEASRFGVLYLGQTVKTCFLEAVLRDQRDGVVGYLPVREEELAARTFADVEIVQPLRLVDLREDQAIVMGVRQTFTAAAGTRSVGRGHQPFTSIRPRPTASSIRPG